MKIFIDTADVEHIRAVHRLGVLAGVTTNPSLVAKEEKAFEDVLRDIVAAVGDLPVNAEVISLEADDMVEEGERLARIADNIVIKVPMTLAGLEACHRFAQKGIRTNVTLIFSANQALMAARAGAAYVSPFIGRLDDINHNGLGLIGDIAHIFEKHALPCEIIAASIRHPLHVTEAAKLGAHIATMPYNVIEQMVKHPMTDLGIERFLADWEQAKK